jgi:hypothetical protein
MSARGRDKKVSRLAQASIGSDVRGSISRPKINRRIDNSIANIATIKFEYARFKSHCWFARNCRDGIGQCSNCAGCCHLMVDKNSIASGVAQVYPLINAHGSDRVSDIVLNAAFFGFKRCECRIQFLWAFGQVASGRSKISDHTFAFLQLGHGMYMKQNRPVTRDETLCLYWIKKHVHCR